jgi:acyl-CoA thioesterase-2
MTIERTRDGGFVRPPMPLVGQAAVDRLVWLLDLEQIEVNIFRGRSPETRVQRVYGGQVAAQALVAAGRTVGVELVVHSLHSYFLRAGDPSVPIVYEVERVRDGRSFSTRRTVAIQHGLPIFFMAASFQRVQDGLDHQTEMPDAPEPESLLTIAEHIAPFPERLEAWSREPRPVDVRYVDVPGWVGSGVREPTTRQLVWFRVDGTLPSDPMVHACALTYASDLTLLDSVLATHGRVWGEVSGASLDHALWFHRPVRVDEWVLYDCESPSASGARGLATGRLYSRDGRLVASAVQEGLLRVAR